MDCFDQESFAHTVENFFVLFLLVARFEDDKLPCFEDGEVCDQSDEERHEHKDW